LCSHYSGSQCAGFLQQPITDKGEVEHQQVDEREVEQQQVEEEVEQNPDDGK
jgi:hypothetical protein